MTKLDFNEFSISLSDNHGKSSKGSDEENDFLTNISNFFRNLSSNILERDDEDEDDEDEDDSSNDMSELDDLPTIIEEGSNEDDDENESPPQVTEVTETPYSRSKKLMNAQKTPESQITNTAAPDSIANNVANSPLSPFNSKSEYRIPGSNIPRKMMDTGLYEKFRKLTEINKKLNNKNIFYVKDITQDNIEKLNNLLEEKEYYKSGIKRDINRKLTKKITAEIKDSIVFNKNKKTGKLLSDKEKETIINDIILIYNGDKDVKDLINILTNKGIINEKDNEKIREIEKMIEKDGLRKYMTEEINNKAFIEDIYGKIFDEKKHNCYLCNLKIGDNIADMEHKIPAVYSLLLIDKLRHFDDYYEGNNYAKWKEYKTRPENKKELIKIYKAINSNQNESQLVTNLEKDLKNKGYRESYINLLVANMYAYSYAHSYCNQAKLSVKFTKITDKNTCSFCVTSNNETITNFTEISNRVYNEIKKSTKKEGAWKIAEDGSRFNESEELYEILTSEPFKKLHNNKRPIDPSYSRFKTGNSTNKIKIRMSLRSFSNIKNISISSNIFSSEHIKRQFIKVSSAVNKYIGQIDGKSEDKSNNFFTNKQLFKAVKHSLRSTYHAKVIKEGKRNTQNSKKLQETLKKIFGKDSKKKKASKVKGNKSVKDGRTNGKKNTTSKIHPKKVSQKNKKKEKRKRSGASLKNSSGISITEQKTNSSSKETKKRQKREEDKQKNNNTRNNRKNEEDNPLRKRLRS
jgi:hypothetical protein